MTLRKQRKQHSHIAAKAIESSHLHKLSTRLPAVANSAQICLLVSITLVIILQIHSFESTVAKIFFSYAHEDEQYRDQLQQHLSSLHHEGIVTSWHDRRILAGAHLNAEIDQQINSADIILLLVSSSFLASQYCYGIEMARALERSASGEAATVAVILRPCDWHNTPLGKFLAVPKDGKPISTWPNYDEAYTDIARQLRLLIQEKMGSRDMTPSWSASGRPVASAAPSTLSVSSTPIRSSNLAITKRFSDLDADRCVNEAFEFVGRFFEGSLEELQKRNPGVSGTFRRVDGNTFTAAIYRDGKRESECSVHLGGGAGGFSRNKISYSSDAAARGGSINEMVTVENDGQAMYFKTMGMASFGTERQKLSDEGVAELLWGMLIKRLQH